MNSKLLFACYVAFVRWSPKQNKGINANITEALLSANVQQFYIMPCALPLIKAQNNALTI